MKDSDLEAYLKLDAARDWLWTVGWMPEKKEWHVSMFKGMSRVGDASGPDLLTVVTDVLAGEGADR